MKRVELREITPENFKKCIDLKVADSQRTCVASNVVSIAESKIYPTFNPAAIYADDKLVGFTMFGLDTDDGRYYLIRLMIDEKHQGKGYGKAATLAVIEKMRETPECREFYTSVVPENKHAEQIYEYVGFVKTGEISEGEIVMRFDMQKDCK